MKKSNPIPIKRADLRVKPDISKIDTTFTYGTYTSPLLTSPPGCRICGASDVTEKNRLISACACSGTVEKIHTECLRLWIEKRPCNGSLHCELCRKAYRVVLSRKIGWETSNLCRWKPCGYFTEAVMLLICLGALTAMLLELLPILEKRQKTTEEAVALLLYITTVVSTLIGVLKVCQKWHSAASVTIIQELDRQESAPLLGPTAV